MRPMVTPLSAEQLRYERDAASQRDAHFSGQQQQLHRPAHPEAFLQSLASKFFPRTNNDESAIHTSPRKLVWQTGSGGGSGGSRVQQQHPEQAWQRLGCRPAPDFQFNNEQGQDFQYASWTDRDGDAWPWDARTPRSFHQEQVTPLGQDLGETVEQQQQQRRQQEQLYHQMQHEQIMGSIKGGNAPGWGRGLGMLRSSSMPSGVSAADGTPARPPARLKFGGAGATSAGAGRTPGASGLRPLWCFASTLLVWLTLVAVGSMLW